MFLDKKTLLKIWLIPWLNLTIIRGTRPRLVTVSQWKKTQRIISKNPETYLISPFLQKTEIPPPPPPTPLSNNKLKELFHSFFAQLL